MARAIKLLWGWSWVLTAPLAAFGLVWLLPAWRDARQFLVYHPASLHRSSDVDLNLKQILLGRLNALQADLGSSWKSRWADQPFRLATIDLEVAPANIARLNGNLPRSGKDDFVRGLLRYPDGNFEKVGVRYRGDSLHHWGFAAKSWLVRTAKDRPIEGQRRWHLVLPRWRSAANYFVNLRMAAHMGLLAVEPRLVNLRINGRQHGGIHLLMPQQDEAFLRKSGRLPSDLYIGDMTPLDDNFVNEASYGGLWELPWLWQKAAIDNKYPADSHRPLEILLFRLHRGDIDSLLDLLDLPAWANFSAYMQLFAASHLDMGHNWKLLYDAGKLTFEPVLGDGNGLPDDILDLTAAVPGRDVSITTPLLARLHQNHRFLRLKNEALARFYREQLDHRFFTEMHAFQEAVASTLAVFPQLDWMGSVDGRPVHYFSDADLRQCIDTVAPRLVAWFAAHRLNQTLQPAQVSTAVVDPRTLRVSVDGYASTRLGLKLPPGTPPLSLRLLIHRPDGHTESVAVNRWLKEEDGITWLDWPLLAQRQLDMPTVTRSRVDHVVRPAIYDIVSDTIDPGACELVAAGALAGPFPVTRVPWLAAIPISLENTDVLPRAEPVVRWRGEVVLEGVTELGGPLVIEAGTRVRLGPGASVIVRGRVTAAGTATQPVSFERLQPNAPWGTFAIVGHAADGTTLEHCLIRGGSGLVSPFALFSGMLSIHDVDGVQMRHCRLSDNREFDDQFHAVYCSLTVSDCEFKSAPGDGIDFDICHGTLDHVTIEQTGNDTLDLMTSKVMVTNCRLARGGDKGISAGEACNVVVLNSLLEENQIGLQAKDGSNAVLYNTTLRGNKIQLSAYHKNISYPGTARITIAKSSISSSGQPFDLHDKSTLALHDSQIFGRWTDQYVSVDNLSNESPAARSPDPAPVFGSLLPGKDWRETDQRRRGCLPDDPTQRTHITR